MNLYLKERKDGTLNLYEPNNHTCLRSGIPNNERAVEESVKYFHLNYGTARRISIKAVTAPSKETQKKRETYLDENDPPYKELVEEIARTYNRSKLKSKPSPNFRSLTGKAKLKPKVGSKPKAKPKDEPKTKKREKKGLLNKLKKTSKRKVTLKKL